MRKVIALLLTIIISITCIFLVNNYITLNFNNIVDKSINFNSDNRNSSDQLLDRIIKETDVVVLGSSELSSSDNLAYPLALYNYGYSNFNMILMGRGYFQSLLHAINAGALQNNLKNNKIVLIVSPQWFTINGMTADAFPSRLLELNYYEFLRNDSITPETKYAVSDRVRELMVKDPKGLQRIKKAEKVYLSDAGSFMDRLEVYVYDTFLNSKNQFELFRDLRSVEYDHNTDEYVNAETIDFDELLEDGDNEGRNSCTNNDFGVNDNYYKEYIEGKIESYKDSFEGNGYTVSPEYSDLKLFLKVCNEIGLEPLIISVPVNGRWYDYTGFPKADRNTYYQNIRNICKEYKAELADFSEREYELYFLRDTMHLGWKGWAYIDEAVYDFYKGRDNKRSIETKELKYEYADSSEKAAYSGSGVFLKSGSTQEFNSVTVSTLSSEQIIDMTDNVGNRSGLFISNGETGESVIRISADSNIGCEYVDIEVFLEKGEVYKIQYSVAQLNESGADIRDIVISEVNY